MTTTVLLRLLLVSCFTPATTQFSFYNPRNWDSTIAAVRTTRLLPDTIESRKEVFEKEGVLGPFSLFENEEAIKVGLKIRDATHKHVNFTVNAKKGSDCGKRNPPPRLLCPDAKSEYKSFFERSHMSCHAHEKDCLDLALNPKLVSLVTELVGKDAFVHGVVLHNVSRELMWHMDTEISSTCRKSALVWMPLGPSSVNSSLAVVTHSVKALFGNKDYFWENLSSSISPPSHDQMPPTERFWEQAGVKLDADNFNSNISGGHFWDVGEEIIKAVHDRESDGRLAFLDVQPGDAVVMNGLTYHGVINPNEESRMAVSIHYAAAECRAREPYKYLAPAKYVPSLLPVYRLSENKSYMSLPSRLRFRNNYFGNISYVDEAPPEALIERRNDLAEPWPDNSGIGYLRKEESEYHGVKRYSLLRGKDEDLDWLFAETFNFPPLVVPHECLSHMEPEYLLVLSGTLRASYTQHPRTDKPLESILAGPGDIVMTSSFSPHLHTNIGKVPVKIWVVKHHDRDFKKMIQKYHSQDPYNRFVPRNMFDPNECAGYKALPHSSRYIFDEGIPTTPCVRHVLTSYPTWEFMMNTQRIFFPPNSTYTINPRFQSDMERANAVVRDGPCMTCILESGPRILINGNKTIELHEDFYINTNIIKKPVIITRKIGSSEQQAENVASTLHCIKLTKRGETQSEF
eukprot:m.70253 g.70253  ORF g.70253 m.70253 type:complete len:685 (+) comp12120_c0_seq1:193-2247(+)